MQAEVVPGATVHCSVAPGVVVVGRVLQLRDGFVQVQHGKHWPVWYMAEQVTVPPENVH